MGLVPPASARLREPGSAPLNFPTSGSHFGAALACGDFDDDGDDDLAVGLPDRDLSAELVDAGRVQIYPGSPAGIGAGTFAVDQDTIGIDDQAESLDGFGSALAAGDFDGDGHADLAVGAHLETESLLMSVGTASVLYGALFADGFDSGGIDYWSDFTP